MEAEGKFLVITQNATPHFTHHDITQDFSHHITQDITHNTVQDFSQDITQDITHNHTPNSLLKIHSATGNHKGAVNHSSLCGHSRCYGKAPSCWAAFCDLQNFCGSSVKFFCQKGRTGNHLLMDVRKTVI